MGQGESVEIQPANPEQLSQQLALRFAEKCYTQLELYCYKQTFRNLADVESDIRYWTESSLVQFLELPDQLCAGPVLFQMASFLGAFPFANQAPAILTVEALLKVITLMTNRFQQVLKRGNQDRHRLFYSSLAVFDRKASQDLAAQFEDGSNKKKELEESLEGISGFNKDEAARAEPEPDDYDEDDDQMTLDALESLDALEAIGFSEQPSVHHSIIPTDNLLRLVELLLFIAPLKPQEKLSQHIDKLSPENLKTLREAATCIISAFCIEAEYGISYRTFMPVVESSLPHMFDGLGALFEHFLFEKDFDLSKRRSSIPISPPGSPRSPGAQPLSPTSISTADPTPILDEPGEILTATILTQISCFIQPSRLFGRLHQLYSGTNNGFSLGAFESAVFNWQAPTILLVSGSLLGSEPSDSQERAFLESLPAKRFPSSVGASKDEPNEDVVQGQTVTYGVYVPQQWRQTHKHPFGDASTILFQLSPVHDVFRASELISDYITFSNSPTSAHPGINIGSALENTSSAKPSPSASAQHVPLGPVSLFMDSSLEFGVFTHTAAGGGAFYPSPSPLRNGTARYRQRRRTSTAQSVASPMTLKRRMTLNSTALAKPGDHQNRFSITSLEVWGIGGDTESFNKQRKEQVDEREMRMRRESIAGGVGGVEAEREILRMAGLVGQYSARGEG